MNIIIITMAKYPIFLEMSGRRAVVIGGGVVAVRKAQSLLAAGTRLVVVAKEIDNSLTALCQHSNAELIRSKYSKAYLAGAVLAIAATNDAKLNKQIYKDCQELEILCNVVDAPELCDFLVPAVVKRADLQIAIGTEGNCPAYAGHVRKKLEQSFTEKHGEFLAELETLRKRILRDVPDAANRKVLLGQLVDDKSFEYFAQNGPAEWHRYVDKLMSREDKS
ncbi:MAG: bifunctional precorrin-2 dehydrogenase/sirohydrochlorin ferrochelatase [Planctomycetota bacterium]|nr:MAG: bifunctional precorrin-2 dehydrogenase/sirohydrochlorin ferrochelatase [Planctomycetota bacterium]